MIIGYMEPPPPPPSHRCSPLLQRQHRRLLSHHRCASWEHIFIWYIFFGIVHEVSHLITAWWLDYPFIQFSQDEWFCLFYEVVLGRQCSLPNASSQIEGPVRHAGWIFSVLLVAVLLIAARFNRLFQYSNNSSSSDKSQYSFITAISSSGMLLAALVTAFEAISTDLIGLKPFLSLCTPSSTTESGLLCFYCGNFGIILLNHWWLQDHHTKAVALDTLQQMIEVTMMRGAQSGGCVTYHPTDESSKQKSNNKETTLCSKAVRSRVVNKKRTDLSKLVRNRVEKDLRKMTTSRNVDANTFVPRMLVGHTRFATSSLSTLDGTHPHQWTPPSPRRVYSMDNVGGIPKRNTSPAVPVRRVDSMDNVGGIPKRNTSPAVPVPLKPTVVTVENFITHNGDFDFYRCHGKLYELETIQDWLSVVTETKTPASVDSCAIAGMVDILRSKGSFGLSARYALALGMESSNCSMKMTAANNGGKFFFPPYKEYLEEDIGIAFEKVLEEYCHNSTNSVTNLRNISSNLQARVELVQLVLKEFQTWPIERLRPLMKALNIRKKSSKVVPAPDNSQAVEKNKLIEITEEDTDIYDDKNDDDHFIDSTFIDTIISDIESLDENLRAFCKITIDAFFDNDLFMTTKIFMENAKGSFGISVTSNLDSHRQMCMAARGQTISIAFYPQKDLVCYGSEQAAVKAGMNASCDGLYNNDRLQGTNCSTREVDNESTRLDLDDLGGEIIVLDWGVKKYQTPPVSFPNSHLEQFHLMNGKITAILHQESKSTKIDSELFHRMTKLSGNSLIQPLKEFTTDPVKTDIEDIPSVCKNIQDDWHSRRASSSLNRLTAFNLSRCLRRRLEQHVAGTVPSMSVDILLTGCEVSLYLAEQFASDLKKSFPKLTIEAVSSNKLLGLYGQEIAVPSLGFPSSPQTKNIHDSIVIIVSHSGGTFGPLACSNLLQSTTPNIFVVTSEWDTQIGKQLRMIDEMDGSSGYLMNQRIFSTEVGMRPAEPCSVSVVATHQLLTNLFEYISVLILSDQEFRRVTKAQITEQDIQILERCNQMNIEALVEIVGFNTFGYPLDRVSPLLSNLRELGNLWGDHILEGARSYIMCFIYIFVTVTSGWPLATAIGSAFGATEGGIITYLVRFLDSCIYFWLPQICITIIRIFQGRNLRHRMVGRTIVIGDIPWVSQCSDAFLSKCFAVSYSIASLNVLSGNPSDHFVHRHTHRVVRGTLAIFGRPDGRLSALATAEGAVCLSCNQASSIQSHGGTCESLTIGHNPFKLDLSKTGIFLKRHRPLFLCERLLIETDAADEAKAIREKKEDDDDDSIVTVTQHYRNNMWMTCKNLFSCFSRKSPQNGLSMSIHSMMDCSISVKIHKKRSSHALVGAYMGINEEKSNRDTIDDETSDETQDSYSVDDIVAGAIRDRKIGDRLHVLFNRFDKDGRGILTEDEFIMGFGAFDPSLTELETKIMYKEADTDHTGEVDYNQFVAFLQNSGYDELIKIPPCNRDDRGLIQIEASTERYFGERLRKYNAGKNKIKDMDFELAKKQHFVQELYETRIASMQRFVWMCVFFHHIAKRVERFFATISFGLWSYRIDRTHSIVRIATTASPISGSDVRNRIERLRLWKKVLRSVHTIELAYLAYRKRKIAK